ncbi:hypothetical protein AADZ90_006910 [Aestuariibius sp. 2305UL40-4]|uniref:hypothetical protein n=1 Tax=Aestuariibius violaceus TaxID=3234132 RepID=UPI00345E22DD
MPLTIRDLEPADLDVAAGLLLEDARQRQAANPTLWTLAAKARDKITATISAALGQDNPPFRQKWLLAEADGEAIGITHTILLPVPPIYAGAFGRPGLIMEDCFLRDDAPDGTLQTLFEAAEADLIEAGARILLGSSVPGGVWEQAYAAPDYDPLTLYFAKTGLRSPQELQDVRPANAADVPAIVASSAENRQILFDLNAFWKPHPDADARFGAWMEKSLTLPDRDMFVSEVGDTVTGYAISQPATPLHFPPPHDISAIGVIDDYYHSDLADPERLQNDGGAAASLLQPAEAALQARGNTAALVVCPAAWLSKIAILKDAGYENAITWFKKRQV